MQINSSALQTNYCALHKKWLTRLTYLFILHCNTTGLVIMASKVASADKRAAKMTAKKAAPASKPKQLVTNIKTVEPTPAKSDIAQGIDIMTNTAEKITAETKATAETVTAKTKNFFADMQVKAGEAADKGKKLASDATEFSKARPTLPLQKPIWTKFRPLLRK
jgi:hypothetical protein